MATDLKVPRLLTIKEVSEQTGIGRWRLYELLASGDLPHLRIGKTFRVPEDALVKWIEQQTSATRGEKE